MIDAMQNALSPQKAVILARGLGTRMRRADAGAALDQQQAAVADTGVKAMIPIGRPFLDYVLSGLADAGYDTVCLVVAPQHDVIKEYYTQKMRPQRLTIEFAVQVEPRGTADAVAAAESFAAGEPVVVLNSDNYYPPEALRGLSATRGSAVALFEREAMLSGSNIAAERIRQFAVGQVGPDGNLQRILEKPSAETLAALPTPLWLSMNCWRFGPAIFEACRGIGPSPRGEFEITDAVQYAIDRLGECFQVVPVRGAVLDLSSRQDIAGVASRLTGMEVAL